MPFFAFFLPFFGNVWIRKTDREEKRVEKNGCEMQVSNTEKVKKAQFRLSGGPV